MRISNPASSQMAIGTRIAATLMALAILVGVAGSGIPQSDNAVVSRAGFETDGRVRRPADYRQWVHVGTRVKIGGLNILDGKILTMPQVLNAYVEPSAMAAYRKTGKWPDGTQIVKEISNIERGAGCDAKTNICTTELGAGIFEDSYGGLGLMVKDSKRYSTRPGYWGYFSFFRAGKSYDRTATERNQDKCAACHARLASQSDYVITKAHLAFGPGNSQ